MFLTPSGRHSWRPQNIATNSTSNGVLKNCSGFVAAINTIPLLFLWMHPMLCSCWSAKTALSSFNFNVFFNSLFHARLVRLCFYFTWFDIYCLKSSKRDSAWSATASGWISSLSKIFLFRRFHRDHAIITICSSSTLSLTLCTIFSQSIVPFANTNFARPGARLLVLIHNSKWNKYSRNNLRLIFCMQK